MRRGAAGVTLRRCRDHDQPAREGARWLDARLTGARHPSPHHPLAKQGVTQLTAPPGVKSRQIKHGAASTLLATSLTAGALTAGIIALSLVPTGAGTDTRAELVVALRHRAPPIEQCTTLSADELNALAPHMRAPRSCVRRRPVSTLRVWVNDTLTLDAAYEPGGMSADGATTALERLRLPAGTHQVRVALGVGEAQLTRAVTLQLEARSRHALILDDGRGWRLIAGGHDVDHGRTHPGE
jgi:hypothetical protein